MLGVVNPCCIAAMDELSRPIPCLVRPESFTDSAYLFETHRYQAISRGDAGSYTGYLTSRPEFRASLLVDRLQANGKPFVNVGPGVGLLEKMVELPSVALDFCAGFLESVGRNVPGTKLILAVAERLPFVTSTVDCLVSDCTFQSILDRERFLYEAWRVTAPGALLLFTVLTSWNYPRRDQNGFDVRTEDGRELLKRFLEELEFSVTVERMSISGQDDYHIWTCRKS